MTFPLRQKLDRKQPLLVNLAPARVHYAYDYFCDEFENMLGAAFGVAPAMQGIGETESDEKDLLRNTITAVVNKVYLDRYLAFYREAQDAAPSEQE